MSLPRLLAVTDEAWPFDAAQTCRELTARGFAAETVAPSDLADAILRRRALPGGQRWRPVVLGLARSAGSIAALLPGPAPPPLLLIEESWLDDRFCLREAGPGWPAGSLVQALWPERRRGLDAALVRDALAAVPPVAARRPAEAAPTWLTVRGPTTDPAALARVAAIAEHHGVAVRLCEDGRDLAVAGTMVFLHPAQSGWRALAAGCEVAAPGSAPYAGLGVTWDLDDDAELDALAGVTSADAGRRSRRDAVRQLLAADILFAAFPPRPALAAARLAELIEARAPPQEPTISIIVNNYNYGAYVGEAIASALAQARPADEVIVVDDGSTDGSADVIAGFPAVTTVFKRNGGQASAFNAGFARATGDVILFLDADDRLLPDAVARVAAAWRPETARLQFALEAIDRAGRSLGLYPGSIELTRGDQAGPVLAHGLHPFMPTSGNAFARWALERILPMPEPHWRICADLYLVLAAAMAGPVARLEAVLGQYRVHGANAFYHPLGESAAFARKNLPSHIAAWRDLAAALGRIAGRPAAVGIWRLRLHRRVLLAAFDRGGRRAQRLREALRAAALAATVADVPAGLRLRHAALPLRLAAMALLGRRPPPASAPLRWPRSAPADPVLESGPSTWPLLGHGATLDARDAPALREALGWGWDWSAAEAGAAMIEDEASLAFVLPPSVHGHWRVSLTFSVAPELLRLRIEINGEDVGPAAVDARGRLALAIPDRLLRHDRPDGCSCLLSLSLPEAGRARPVLAGLGVRMLPTGSARIAPRLEAGRFLAVGAAAAGNALLADGWGWPEAGGAAMAETRAALVFAAPLGRSTGALRLELDAATADGPVLPAAFVNGEPAALHRSGDPRFATVLVEPAAIDADGFVRLELVAREDLATGAWPRTVLRGLRLDDLGRDRRLAFDRRYDFADPAGPLHARGLAANGTLVGPDALVQFEPIPGGGELVLELFLAGGGDGRVDLTIGGRHIPAVIGGVGRARLRIAPAPTVTLRIAFAGHGHLACAWLALAPAEPDPAPALPAEPQAMLDAAALQAHAVRRADWHPAVDGVLWLAGDAGELDIAVDPQRHARIEVTLVLVEAMGQALDIAWQGIVVTATRSGVHTLPVPPGTPTGPARLAFRSRLLVNVGVLAGEANEDMLGGGVAGIALPVPTGTPAPG